MADWVTFVMLDPAVGCRSPLVHLAMGQHQLLASDHIGAHPRGGLP